MGIVINLDITPTIAWDAEHVHDGEPVRMGGTDIETDKRSDEFHIVRATFDCPQCASEVRLMASINVDLRVIQAYQTVVAEAGPGHRPPDHGWTGEPGADCPLCAALNELRAEGTEA